MSESAKYEGYKKKLEGICDENDLVYSLSVKAYPITLTIRPVQGMDEQMTLLAEADDKPYNSPDASIVFFVKDGELTYKMSERFTIGDALFSKIKNLFRNLHFTYLQMFHRDVTEKGLLNKPYVPSESEDTNEKFTEPLEEYIDEDDETDQEETPDFPDDLLEEDADEAQPEEMPRDEWLIGAATDFVREQNEVSINALAKEFHLTFAGAAKLMEQLEDAGVVGAQTAGGKRQVLPFEEV